MQGSQGVCVSTSIGMESRLRLTAFRSLATVLMLGVLLLGWAAIASAQVNTATLSGTVSDPQGLPLKGAKVSMTNTGTGAQRTTVTDEEVRRDCSVLPHPRRRCVGHRCPHWSR